MRYLGVVLFAVDGANRQATRRLERGRRHGCGLVRRSSSAIAPDMGAVLYDNVMDDDLVDEFEVAKHVFVCARARAPRSQRPMKRPRHL